MIQDYLLSIIIFVIILVFYVIDFYFMLHYDRQRQSGKGWSWDYTLLTILMGLAIVLQPMLFPRLGWTTSHKAGLALQGIGLFIVAASLGLHVWARQHLQKFYAERVEVQPDHQVVQTGPYAYVRHPVISSFFGLAAGLLLLNPALTTILALIYAIWDFTRAARQEEELLKENLSGYADYMQRVPRFLPRLGKTK